MIAPYLTSLQDRLKARGVHVGSYPVLSKGVFVSLIGRCDSIGDVAKEVELELDGRILSEQEIEIQKASL